ncbi:Uncharacterized protein Adt_28621 [Abeliophyllum distichum]|uniref:Late embryogenesis abundant protein LEA-2 subgroup domain-containing protein n=1 Tax=Abeliophyllum distichum TaxID=126358 RepID=A0ABD1RX16_9LAMI
MSSSIPQNGDQVVVQGFPVSTDEPHVVYGFPVMAQPRYTTVYFSPTEVSTDRAIHSTQQDQLEFESFDSVESPSDDDINQRSVSAGAFIAVTVIFFGLMGGLVYLLVLITHVHHPVFLVESASISMLNESAGNPTMASLNIGILTRNPNEMIVFEYDEFDVRVSGNSEDIFGTKIAAFNSSSESETLLNATAVVPLANISGIINIDVNLHSKVFLLNWYESTQQTINVLCKDVVIKKYSGATVKGCSVNMSNPYL